jgi:hypothetical protein
LKAIPITPQMSGRFLAWVRTGVAVIAFGFVIESSTSFS